MADTRRHFVDFFISQMIPLLGEKVYQYSGVKTFIFKNYNGCFGYQVYIPSISTLISYKQLK